MSTLIDLSRSTQQVVCMFLSALIVSATLSLGAYGAQSVFEQAVAQVVRS